jgi:hypothetical protein
LVEAAWSVVRHPGPLHERDLAHQAEASYKRTVSDWQAARPAKAGASVTPERAY